MTPELLVMIKDVPAATDIEIEQWLTWDTHHNSHDEVEHIVLALIARIRQEQAKAHAFEHASDCSVNNGPALPVGDCDCKNVTEPQAIAEPELGDAAEAKPCIAAPVAAPVQVKALEETLEQLLHAVCGETGFANAVRIHTGTAYPWPALDIAEERARAALRALSGDTSNG